jgi:hypothetical protein
MTTDELALSGLRQHEEVVVTAPQDEERRDHPGLRGEEERRARLAGRQRLDVVRDHPLQVVGRIGPRDADELPRSRSNVHAI